MSWMCFEGLQFSSLVGLEQLILLLLFLRDFRFFKLGDVFKLHFSLSPPSFRIHAIPLIAATLSLDFGVLPLVCVIKLLTS